MSKPKLTPKEPVDMATAGPVRVGKGMTKAGSRLRFGDTAVVPVQYFVETGPSKVVERRGVLSITVRALRMTKTSSLQVTSDPENRKILRGQTVYYAVVDVTNETDADLSSYGPPTLIAEQRGGRTPLVFVTNDQQALDGCGGFVFFKPAMKGAVSQGCVVGLAPAKDPITEIHYHAVPYGWGLDDQKPDYSKYYGLGDIVWS
ncbi:hypothetical protein [Kribbella sp. NPDC051620]|uniref:hypothetical protein n=1 Tax=Kribbella sp. NPDC051620 TaxID=3364120 RepID=UPI0037A4A8F1